ncbi:all-trans-retinol 13,14-reductase [Elysia marginata]|uniref:All-trans-retinol 13,14-reductase n=1 Tax=Elysia marginata TaxID=1093978 RepID=A0AAV4I001_9GAST|nr:all-trans-retinol 13,14-reductase [Elysia marginata]
MIDIGVRSIIDFLASNPLLLVGAFLLYIVVFLFSVFFHPVKGGKNPLAKDYRRPHEGFIHDVKARDAVIKQRFKASKVPEHLDVIVIGSGIGGLTSGVLLARAGKKVLVLEQHDQAGGCCHSFVEKGFEFDTGIHYIGSMYDGSVDRVLLDQLTCDQLKWAKMDDAFDTVAVGPSGSAERFPMKTGKESYTQNLIAMFPKEKAAIEKYMELIYDASPSFFGVVLLKVLPWPIARLLVATGLYKILFKCYRKRYTERTLQEVLDELTDDSKLKMILSYICGDYGVFPNEVPFILHALVVKHYVGGAWYPAGGTSEIAFHMVQSIQNLGGRVLVQAPVTEIVCNSKGRAVGVKVAKMDTTIQAKIIISDAGVVNTFKSLLPQQVAQASRIYPLISKIGPSCSFITTFIGVEGSPSELKLPAGNVWHFNSEDINKTMSEFLQVKGDHLEDVEIPLGYISFPSAKDPEWEKKFPGKSSVLIITLASWEWFKEWKEEKLRHRGDRYETIKDTIGRKMWEQCVDLFPQLEGKKVYMEVGTPVTNQHYLACPEGEMYGLNQGAVRFQPDVAMKLRAQTDIPGLYLTGQDIMTCGFTSALIMGLMTAGEVLHLNLYNDLLKLRKTLKAVDQAAAAPASNGTTSKKSD